MSHPDEGVLQELLDGELPPADAEAVRAHLAGCVPCAVILRDLAATQAASDAIVARLPLDPPIVRRAPKVRRPLNLRAIGLAASVVLVAGTSWVLLRSTPRNFTARDDSAAGLALPMPSEERQEVPATTPAAPPAPSAGARADANAEAPFKTKQVPQKADAAVRQAPREADAPAPQLTAKDLASQAQPQAQPETEKKEAVDETRRANGARPANAPAPVARMAPAAAPASLAAGAVTAPEATLTTLSEAEARLGTRLRTISGLAPVSVEVLPLAADSLLAVRQRYVVSGVPVVLIQQVSSAVPYAEDARVQASIRGGHGFVAAGESAGRQSASRSWAAWGSLFELRGALPADSIDALVKRVK